ncbi:PorP/SprF family type IX secretion system membrane protein [Formosa sp. S-31]|uniref:PorP/SprF family type IX secretion system membrane protein n=1 Tax=Formosa sp. S-31 TaxID=2790949 RepID=UPI003EBBB065
MIKHYIILFFIVQLAAVHSVCAQDGPVLSLDVPAHNNLKFNRFLQNPTFSYVREDHTNIALYHRNQWISFNDSPKTYLVSYSGKFSDHTGLGIGLYQQNLGVITSFGALANYAYNIRLNEDMNLTLGFNLAYYNSGVNRNKTIVADSDPRLYDLENNALLTIEPGINLSYKQFDFGVFADNLVDFDFKSSKLAKDYIPKTFAAHAMYTHPILSNQTVLEASVLQVQLKARTNEITDFGYGASAIFDAPHLGWVQTAYDDYYGISAGLGVHITSRLSIGYTYEKTLKNNLNQFGATHEFNMAFAINHERKSRVFETYENDAEKIVADLEKEQQQEVTQRLNELETELDDYTLPLLEKLTQDETISSLEKEELEARIANLKAYSQRAKNTKLNGKSNQPIVLRNVNATSTKVEPKTLEDLKQAENGYYLVSTPISKLNKKDLIEIKRYNLLPEAISALEDKKKKNKDQDIYIVHVDNLKPNTVQVEKTELQIAQEEVDKSVRNNLILAGTDQLKQSPKAGVTIEMKDVPVGYYIVANVFSEYSNATNFMKVLNDRGLKADSFINPLNNYMYVYLKKFNTWQEALISYYTNVNNTYYDTIWIMPINTELNELIKNKNKQ